MQYAIEYKNNIETNNYYHSPSLQRILNLFRSGPKKGKYVIIKSENGKFWNLGTLPEKRGQKIKIFKNISFKTNQEAEWYVFKKRWNQITNKKINI